MDEVDSDHSLVDGVDGIDDDDDGEDQEKKGNSASDRAFHLKKDLRLSFGSKSNKRNFLWHFRPLLKYLKGQIFRTVNRIEPESRSRIFSHAGYELVPSYVGRQEVNWKIAENLDTSWERARTQGSISSTFYTRICADILAPKKIKHKTQLCNLGCQNFVQKMRA